MSGPASPIVVTRSSALRASADVVAAAVLTMPGVNIELSPWVRMTFPARSPDLMTAEEDDLRFTSWLLVGGAIPFDRHSLRIVERTIGPDVYGFAERSTSWLQRRWDHDRRIVPGPNGCTVSDRVVVEPRLHWVRPIAERMVAAVFDRRHASLRSRFG